ncbi:MAG: DUF4129 domain-containing protein [Solirubrobacteraceae bacterium]
MTGLTAVIAMAARAPLAPSTPVNAASARAPVTALAVLLVGAGVVALGGLAIVMWPARRRRGDDEPEPVAERLQVHWIWKLLAILLTFALGAALVAAAVLGAKAVHRAPQLGVGGGGGLARPPAAPGAPRGAESGFVVPSWLPWTVLAIVVLAIGVGIGLLLRWLRPAVDGAPETTATRAAVQSAIAALGAATDPRAAVIAAYAAMERTLAAEGVARSPAEAPREYLQRVLVASSATEWEARTLTGLFEEARFSAHPIPERVRELALSALDSLRARLPMGGAG